MKYQDFLAVNLDDFHQNQHGGSTTCEIVFLHAPDSPAAQEKLKSLRPHTPFFVLPKSYCDRHIMYRPGPAEDAQ
jgi:hypothetical protein